MKRSSGETVGSRSGRVRVEDRQVETSAPCFQVLVSIKERTGREDKLGTGSKFTNLRRYNSKGEYPKESKQHCGILDSYVDVKLMEGWIIVS